jgi:hypothetical protein
VPLIAALVSLLFAARAFAQTEWSIEGSIPTYGEYNSPPACPIIPPPYAVNGAPVPPPGCPTIAPFPPLSCRGGGTGVDNNGNFLSGGPAFPAIVNTDGFTITMTTPAGAYIASWPVPPGAILPGPINGLDYNSAADIIWITDGFFAAGLALVPPCGIPPIAIPPFPVIGCTGAPACGIGWSPCTGTVWTCDLAGAVNNFAIGGAFLSCFPAGLGGPLTGLTVNATNGNIQVTTGFVVAEFTPAGALAPAGAFYLSANPYPIPLWAAPVDGLGFSLRPQNYGVGFSPIGPPPTITFGGGYPFAGNGGFTVSEIGASPGALTVLIVGFAQACPPLPIAGVLAPSGLFILPPFKVFGVGVIPGSGTKVVPAPLPGPAGGPCGPPVGIPLRLQFVNFGGPIPPGFVAISNALAFTIGAI